MVYILLVISMYLLAGVIFELGKRSENDFLTKALLNNVEAIQVELRDEIIDTYFRMRLFSKTIKRILGWPYYAFKRKLKCNTINHTLTIKIGGLTYG